MKSIIDKLLLSENEKKKLLNLLENNPVIEVIYLQNNIYLTLFNGKKIILKNSNYNLYKLFYDNYLTQYTFKNKRSKKSVAIWEDDEIAFLKNNHTSLSLDEISECLKKSKYQISEKVATLNLINKKKWTEEEYLFLKENINLPTVELAISLNRTISSIRSKKRIIQSEKTNKKS